MCGVTLNDKLRNEVREHYGVKGDVMTKLKRICCDGLVILRG